MWDDVIWYNVDQAHIQGWDKTNICDWIFKQLPYWANLLRTRLEFSLLLHMSVRVSPFIFLPKLQSQLCGLAAYAYNRYEKDTNPKKQNYKQ